MAERDPLLALLVCPQCRGELVRVERGLRCPGCRLIFPVIDGVPRMVPEEAEREGRR